MKIVIKKRIITTLIPDAEVGGIYDVSNEIADHLVGIGVAEKVDQEPIQTKIAPPPQETKPAPNKTTKKKTKPKPKAKK